MEITNKTLNTKKPTICLVCNHVLSLSRPILYVAYDDDHVWKISCRPIGHKINELKITPLDQVIQLDSSMTELLDMPPGVASLRSHPNNNWEPFLLYPEKETVEVL